ncbi:MAG TPA: chemotaxis protein CheW, partial [Terriglobales bacterium]|nr:chemotaxis protein CheW [Terriglobales bacterium]
MCRLARWFGGDSGQSDGSARCGWIDEACNGGGKMMNASQQFCTFFLDGLFFGVEVEKVQEVIRHQKTTTVPLAQDVIGGLINLRGQIV